MNYTIAIVIYLCNGLLLLVPAILVPSSVKSKKFHPIFFMHIPKTGGSSIEKYFQLIGAKVQFFDEFNHLNILMKCSPVNHLDYELIDQIFYLKKFRFSFAITRNPFARLASEFRFRRGRNCNWSKEVTIYDEIEPWTVDVLRSYAKNKYFFSNHIRPQLDFIGPNITKVYKLESGLSAIIDSVSDYLLPFKCVLPSYESVMGFDDMMVTSKSARAGLVSKEEEAIRQSSIISELIRQVYRCDFDAFGYS